MSGTDLAVIIVSHNTRDMLRACLRSLYDGLTRFSGNAQVWVVDNASSDGSPEMVRAEFPQTQMLDQGRNLGFAVGNNAALRELGFAAGPAPRPEHVLFLNPDTEVLGDALERMANALSVTENAGVVGASRSSRTSCGTPWRAWAAA